MTGLDIDLSVLRLAFTGPGRFSLDPAPGLSVLTRLGWSVAAVLVGVVAPVPMLLRRLAALRPQETEVSP
jgi:hypothetical protein